MSWTQDMAKAFAEKFGALAIELEKQTGVPALVTLAQASVESAWGDKAPGNAYFGIKADPSWKGAVQSFTTTEYIGGVEKVMVLKFRKYASYIDSFRDYTKFLRTNGYYAPAFKTHTPEDFARAVGVHYATGPAYGDTLVQRIGLIRPYLEDVKKKLAEPPQIT